MSDVPRRRVPEGADEFRAATELRAKDEGRTLVGYAAVFDTPTEINSWEGHFVERIAPGAFKRTLNNNSDRVKVLLNHGQGHIGDLPLGSPSVMREDGHGLYVEVPLSDTDYNREQIVPLLRDGALDGMSFRFSVPAGGDVWDESGDIPVRTINELKLFEFGPVTFPAYPESTADVRNMDPRFEASLRSQFGEQRDGDSADAADASQQDDERLWTADEIRERLGVSPQPVVIDTEVTGDGDTRNDTEVLQGDPDIVTSPDPDEDSPVVGHSPSAKARWLKIADVTDKRMGITRNG
jgi:HK97 family phage prohead protease